MTVRELGPGETALAARTLLELRPALGSAEALVRQIRGKAGASAHGVGLGYEGLEDSAVLEAGMVVQLGLEAAGVLGGDMVLIGETGAEQLTTFAYPTVDA